MAIIWGRMIFSVWRMILGAFRAVILLAALVLASAPLRAEVTEEHLSQMKQEVKDFKYQVVQSQAGLNYRVPEDMPIEKRAGIEAPIPFDEYMYGKFKQIDSRLENIEKKLDHIDKSVSPRSEAKPAASESLILKSGN